MEQGAEDSGQGGAEDDGHGGAGGDHGGLEGVHPGTAEGGHGASGCDHGGSEGRHGSAPSGGQGRALDGGHGGAGGDHGGSESGDSGTVEGAHGGALDGGHGGDGLGVGLGHGAAAGMDPNSTYLLNIRLFGNQKKARKETRCFCFEKVIDSDLTNYMDLVGSVVEEYPPRYLEVAREAKKFTPASPAMSTRSKRRLSL